MFLKGVHVNGFVSSGGLLRAQKGRRLKKANRTLRMTGGQRKSMDGFFRFGKSSKGEWRWSSAPDDRNVDA
jgi:hypothetical protein